ncbi:MAG: ABC transporter permease [Dehalococcoidia bacterium]
MSGARPLAGAAVLAAHDNVEPRASKGPLALAWDRFRRDRVAMVALAILGALCLIAAMAPAITTYVVGHDPNRGRLTERFSPPSSAHLLGADELGRDTLARLIHAGRVSLTIGFSVAAIQLTIGVSFGLLAGYFRGWVDDAINAVIQVLNNLPGIYILIMLSVLFRPNVLGLSIIFGVLGWTGVARQVRGKVLSERSRDYVDAARSSGAGNLRLMYRHILPNVSSVVLVLAGFDIAGAILSEAALSALGFGVRIPTPSWGNMLSKSLEYVNRGWWLVLAPGALIGLTVFCLFYLTDAIRDALDPRVK